MFGGGRRSVPGTPAPITRSLAGLDPAPVAVVVIIVIVVVGFIIAVVIVIVVALDAAVRRRAARAGGARIGGGLADGLVRASTCAPR
jgi:hypothetical protein